MASLADYYYLDFPAGVLLDRTITVATEGGGDVVVNSRLRLDFQSNSKFITCYIPATDLSLETCAFMLSMWEDLKEDHLFGGTMSVGDESEGICSSRDLHFTGKFYIYTDSDVTFEKLAGSVPKGVYLTLRNRSYALKKSAAERPLAFISHDTRDKDAVARPIAVGLSNRACPVWFDEFALKVGDPLRESIERGLKDCRKCVLVLSPNFLSNSGWTKAEFNSIFTRELIDGQNLVLPVWHGVTKQQVYDYSPSLLDRLGIPWDRGGATVIDQLHKAIMAEPQRGPPEWNVLP